MTISEEKVWKIWCDVFGNNDITADDNFFEIGGDSIKGMLIIRKLTEQLSRSIEPADFFEYQSIHEIAENIDKDYGWRTE